MRTSDLVIPVHCEEGLIDCLIEDDESLPLFRAMNNCIGIFYRLACSVGCWEDFGV